MAKANEVKIQIYNLEDRLEVAKILIKNGYTVSQGSEPAPGKKSNVYFIKAQLDESNLTSR